MLQVPMPSHPGSGIHPQRASQKPGVQQQLLTLPAAESSRVQHSAAGDGSPTRTSEALGSYRRPRRAKPSSFSPERWVLRGEGEWTRTSSSSHCSKSTGQIRDTDRAGRPAALGACTSSSFFVVSIGGQAGQSHFFLRVLQVICKRQREVKGELNGKPFITQNAT